MAALLCGLPSAARAVATLDDAQVFETRPGFRLGTHAGYSQPSVSLKTGAGTYEYAPRLVSRPGMEVNYGGFGFSMTLPGAAGWDRWADWARAGSARGEGLNDFRTHWHGATWGVEAHHRHARGLEVTGAPRELQPSTWAWRAPQSRDDASLRLTDLTVYRALDPDSRVYRISEGRARDGGDVDFFVMMAASRARLQGDRDLLAGLPGSGAGEGASRFHGSRAVEVTSLAAGAGYAISGNLHGLYIDQSLFAGYGPQFRDWGNRRDAAWNLAKVNVRLNMGLRTRWFDVGAGFENDAHAALAGGERALFHALVARAGV